LNKLSNKCSNKNKISSVNTKNIWRERINNSISIRKDWNNLRWILNNWIRNVCNYRSKMKMKRHKMLINCIYLLLALVLFSYNRIITIAYFLLRSWHIIWAKSSILNFYIRLILITRLTFISILISTDIL